METISTKIVNSNKAIFVYFIFATFTLLTSIYLAFYLLNQKSTLFVGFFISYVPLFFFDKYLEYFTKKCDISFDFEKINLKVYDRITNSLIDDMRFEYSLIHSFSSYDATKDNGSYLKIKLKDHEKYSYRFLSDERNECTNIVYKYILNYNKTQLENDKIKYISGFFTTKTGNLLFRILTLILIMAIFFHLILFKLKNMYYVIPGVILYFGIIVQRKNDFDFEKKWKEKQKQFSDI